MAQQSRRVLPAELIDKLFASLCLNNAFPLLAKMPNGLLARNVQKMINDIKMGMKENKCNMADCGQKLTISEDGFIVQHSGLNEFYCVLSIFPIFPFKMVASKPIIAFYFEVQFLNDPSKWNGGIRVGFCSQEFPLEGERLGSGYSIGICITDYGLMKPSLTSKMSIGIISIVVTGDVVGLGIICQPNSSIECFVTCNGQLNGKIELPVAFSTMKLFPSVTLFYTGDIIRANFAKEALQTIHSASLIIRTKLILSQI